MVPMTTVDTKNILFICGGAFPELEEVIKERLNKEASIGFKADLKDKYDKEENLLCKVTVEDVRKFGMIPEFLGRLPILFSLEALTEDMLVRILTEPKNAIVRQYKSFWRWMKWIWSLRRALCMQLQSRRKKRKSVPVHCEPLLKSSCWISCMRFQRMTISESDDHRGLCGEKGRTAH